MANLGGLSKVMFRFTISRLVILLPLRYYFLAHVTRRSTKRQQPQLGRVKSSVTAFRSGRICNPARMGKEGIWNPGSLYSAHFGITDPPSAPSGRDSKSLPNLGLHPEPVEGCFSRHY
jgi:hypothetical protein